MLAHERHVRRASVHEGVRRHRCLVERRVARLERVLHIEEEERVGLRLVVEEVELQVNHEARRPQHARQPVHALFKGRVRRRRRRGLSLFGGRAVGCCRLHGVASLRWRGRREGAWRRRVQLVEHRQDEGLVVRLGNVEAELVREQVLRLSARQERLQGLAGRGSVVELLQAVDLGRVVTLAVRHGLMELDEHAQDLEPKVARV